MSNISYWVNKAGFSLANRFIVFFFNFATYFLMVRHLDKSSFGIYSLYLVIVTISELAISAFVQNGFVKFYLDVSYIKNQVLCASIVLNILLTTISALLIFILSGFIGDFYNHQDLSIMLRIYCMSSFFIIPYSQLYYYLNAEVNFKLISFLSLLRYGSFFLSVLVVYIFFSEAGQVDFVILQAGSVGLGAIASIIYINRIKFSIHDFNFRVFKNIFHFGKYIFGVGITSILTRSIDQLMIGYFLSTEAVATYGIAGKFMNFIEVPITSIAHAVYPKFAETVNVKDSKGELAKIYEGSVGTMLAIIAPFVLILFILPSFFITIVAGDKYLDAVPILQLLIAFNLLKPFGTQAGAVLEVSGKPYIGFYALLFTTILNIALNYFLIQMDGPFGNIMGAALASVISSVCFLIIVLKAIQIECSASLFKTLIRFISAYKIGFKILHDKVKRGK